MKEVKGILVKKEVKYSGGLDGGLSGGLVLQDTFLDKINDNKFWLIHHFVPSHDLEPHID